MLTACCEDNYSSTAGPRFTWDQKVTFYIAFSIKFISFGLLNQTSCPPPFPNFFFFFFGLTKAVFPLMPVDPLPKSTCGV